MCHSVYFTHVMKTSSRLLLRALRREDFDASTLNECRDAQQNNLLHYAVIYLGDGQRTLLEKLLDRYQQEQISVDQHNQFGLTPMFLGERERRSRRDAISLF